MAKPTYNVIAHGQQAWDADLDDNFDILEDQAIPVPEYANFAALPAAASYDECLAVTTDTKTLYMSNGTSWVEVGANPAYVMVSEVQTTSTDGSNSSATTWNQRAINTEDADTASIASIASDQITLPAGTYRCRISAIAWKVGAHMLRLYDDTGSAVLLAGLNARTLADDQNTAELVGRFTIGVSSALEIQHYTENAVTSGLGTGNDVQAEVYMVAEFWKE